MKYAYRYMECSPYLAEENFKEGCALLPPQLRAYAAEPQDAKARARRLSGLLLLTVLYASEVGHGALPPIVFLEKGKPDFSEGPYHFNISHSENLAICLLADTPCGVDIEVINKEKLARREGIARRFFTEGERALLTASQGSARTFTEIWVKKEAATKRSGEGAAALKSTDTTKEKALRTFPLTDADGREYCVALAL